MSIQSSTTDPSRESQPGTAEGPRIIGRYALHHALASGGMATVYLGRLVGPVGFSRTVAIKRLHPQFARDPEFVAMFLDEARVAARIRHPNVVPTLDVVATEGELFLVMDYVQGEALSQLFRAVRQQDRAVPAPIAVNILLGVLHGLHAAHEATNERGEPLGIVHRDVSPQNVLVGTDGVPRIVDFGVAKAVGRLQTTREGQLKGKAAYMAPEQVRGGEVTRQADVFAASVVLWEALTGRRLFQGNSDAETIYRLLDAPIEPPSRLVEGIPPALDAVVLKGLARDAASRYASALEMALVLEKTLGMVSSREVGAWVHDMAGARLDERNQQVLAIEQSSSGVNLETLKSGLMGGEREPTSGVETAARGAPTGAGITPRPGQITPPPDITSADLSVGLHAPSRKPTLAVVGVLLGLVVFVGIGVVVRGSGNAGHSENGLPPTASVSAKSVVGPAVLVAATTSVAAADSAQPPAATTATTTAPPATTAARTPPTAKGGGNKAAPATTTRKPPTTPGGLHGID